MRQRGQVLELKTTRPDGQQLWAYRYRPGGRDSKRVFAGVDPEQADAALREGTGEFRVPEPPSSRAPFRLRRSTP
jgi:hypothetical protein